MSHKLFTRAALLGGLCLFSASALADGSGTLNDSGLTLSYSGGPLVLFNPLSSDPPAVCEEGTPTCDVYTLTVDLSEDFRNAPANDKLRVSFTLSFGADDDWDMWMYDASGAEIALSADINNPEVITLGLKQLPNGVYKFHITPFIPATAAFDLTADATGAKSAAVTGKSGSGLALGAFAPLMLLGMLLAAAFRVTRLGRRRG
ncbi:MAG: hypothetical protein AABY95_11170 [Pseudomonadota bacterium]